jgi:hypothetical protein
VKRERKSVATCILNWNGVKGSRLRGFVALNGEGAFYSELWKKQKLLRKWSFEEIS